jgi:outer membrane protein OmpA-like peptidoglycan-associated protein
VPDATDRCLNEKGTVENQGCPAVQDTDGDGVPNATDNCPDEKGTVENAGCPAAAQDTDGDGVPDATDRCPNEKGAASRQGCPEPAAPPVKEEQFSLADRKLVFPVGVSEIQGDGARMLDEIAALLKSRPEVSLRIEGHTDNTGPDQLNHTLSQDRANAVRDSLIQRGIVGSRLEARGYGPSRPLASNDTPEGRRENRRVEFIVTK